ncbi:hypothetical protein [Clostridium sp. JN-1]|jgi:hypothetical protein|uniref:hypothetical protein n=1 Tax=Clostridium sp. JN-1 TaxID=2483110 RepID=UPI000F0BB3AF|nr:hypothetical protein [Clostridium sp. JN-1]
MLKLTIVDILLRTIPEAFLFIISAYLFSLKKIDKKRCVTATFMLGFCTYLIRELPIHYGVHIIINMIVYASIIVIINKIDIINAITYSLGAMMLLSICEWLNLLALNILVSDKLHDILQNPVTKNLCFIPSLILFIAIVLLIYSLIKKRNARI